MVRRGGALETIERLRVGDIGPGGEDVAGDALEDVVMVRDGVVELFGRGGVVVIYGGGGIRPVERGQRGAGVAGFFDLEGR